MLSLVQVWLGDGGAGQEKGGMSAWRSKIGGFRMDNFWSKNESKSSPTNLVIAVHLDGVVRHPGISSCVPDVGPRLVVVVGMRPGE